MAIVNELTGPEVRARLEAKLRQSLPGGDSLKLVDVELPGAGLSFQTLCITVEREIDGRRRTERLIARVEPPAGTGVFREYDLEREVRVLEALRETQIPVPRIHFYEADPEVFGAPFTVMEHVPGKTTTDSPSYMRQGWVLDLSPEDRRRMWTNGLRMVANLHSVDWRRLGLDWLARPNLGGTPLDEQIADWERIQAWGSEGHANPVVDATMTWVKENRPEEVEPIVLSWGDAKPGNMLYADDLTVTTALDFEMVSLASPELDLGWWLFAHRYHAAGLDGGDVPEGMLGRDEVIERYQDYSGHEVRHAHYYEVLGGLRVAILNDRGSRMMMAAGLLPPEDPAPYNNQATRSLAELLDLPAPEGTSRLRDFEASPS